MLKKPISLLLIFCMLFCLSACVATGTNSTPTNTPSEAQTDVSQNTDEIILTEPENSQESSNTEVSKENDTTQTQSTVNQSKPTSTTNQPAHTHIYSNATCTLPKKCSCGATVGIALGHQFSSATCTSPQICSRCGATSGNALGHSYSAANCNSPKTCTRCGQTSGSALGHNYVANKCSRCGKVDPDSLPVGLNELPVIDATYNCKYYNGSLTDSFGNGYVGYYRLYDTSGPACAIFNLNYKYSIFSCEIVTNCKDASFSIYVDNVLKYQTTNLSKLEGPIHVDINVKNGQQLKVVADDNTYSYSEVGFLVNAQLTK